MTRKRQTVRIEVDRSQMQTKWEKRTPPTLSCKATHVKLRQVGGRQQHITERKHLQNFDTCSIEVGRCSMATDYWMEEEARVFMKLNEGSLKYATRD